MPGAWAAQTRLKEKKKKKKKHRLHLLNKEHSVPRFWSKAFFGYFLSLNQIIRVPDCIRPATVSHYFQKLDEFFCEKIKTSNFQNIFFLAPPVQLQFRQRTVKMGCLKQEHLRLISRAGPRIIKHTMCFHELGSPAKKIKNVI